MVEEDSNMTSQFKVELRTTIKKGLICQPPIIIVQKCQAALDREEDLENLILRKIEFPVMESASKETFESRGALKRESTYFLTLFSEVKKLFVSSVNLLDIWATSAQKSNLHVKLEQKEEMPGVEVGCVL